MLYGDFLTSYQHVERLGKDETDGLLNGDVEVQPKLDGANLTVAYDSEHGLIVASRNQAVSIGGNPPTGFRGAVEYAMAHNGIITYCHDTGAILRGEWLVKHGTSYDKEALNRFYVFDVELLGEYVPYDAYVADLKSLGVLYVPRLVRLHCPTLEDVATMLPGGELGAPQREGIVCKRYGFINQYGRTVWGKLVVEKPARARPERGPTEQEDAFAQLATDAFIRKLIALVAEGRGESPNVRHMGEVIGRAWHDLVQEEIWHFIHKGKVGAFDFRAAEHAVNQAVRTYALSYYGSREVRDEAD